MAALAVLLARHGWGRRRAWSQLQLSRYPGARHGGMYMTNYYLPQAPTSTPWAPSWRPDGQRTSPFHSNGSLWDVDPEDGSATEIVHGDFYASHPDVVARRRAPGLHRRRRREARSTCDCATSRIGARCRTHRSRTGVQVEPRFSPERRPPRLGDDRAQRLLQRGRLAKSARQGLEGETDGRHLRPRVSAQSSLLRPLGHAPFTDLAPRAVASCCWSATAASHWEAATSCASRPRRAASTRRPRF